MPTTINTSRPYNPMSRLGAAALACGLAFIFGLSCRPNTAGGSASTTAPDKSSALMQGLHDTGNDGLRAITRSDASAFADMVCAHSGDRGAQMAALLAPSDELWSRRFLTQGNVIDFIDQAVLHYC